ncbi:MAG: PriCT-2 domain-containing protein [Sedimenticola sp.]|nr:PriCT-2 domain-containing protein [Sedimenticola sp.]
MNITKIPNDLRNCGRSYVAWKAEDRGGAKPSKVPYGAYGIARVNNPKHWLTFNEAVDLYKSGDYNGIGIMVLKELELIGLDFDQCICPETKEITRLHSVIEQIQDSDFYIEYSPSGTGLRAFTYGRLAQDYNQDGVEIYGGNSPRYLTLTGDVFPGSSEIGPGQPQIDAVIDSLGFGKRLVEVRPSYIIAGSNRGNENVADDPVALNVIQDALQRIHPAYCPYQTHGIVEIEGHKTMGWLNVGMALHANASLIGGKAMDTAYKLWDEWSKYDPNRYRPGSMAYKWKSFGKAGRTCFTGIGTLFKCAQLNGWTFNLGAYHRHYGRGAK